MVPTKLQDVLQQGKGEEMQINFRITGNFCQYFIKSILQYLKIPKSQYSDILIIQHLFIFIYQYLDIQIFRYSNIPIPLNFDISILRFCTIPIFSTLISEYSNILIYPISYYSNVSLVRNQTFF